jgi:long-chain acyl-CoA synthetase
MATEQAARQAVVDRLTRLFHEWGGEHAIQFEGRWTTWATVGELADRLRRELSSRGVTDTAAIAIVMRQRPALLATELGVLSLGRTALLITPLQGDRSLADDIIATAPPVVIAHDVDWNRPGIAESVASAGSLGLAINDDFEIAVQLVPGSALPAGAALDAAVTVLTSGTTGMPKRLPVRWRTFVTTGGGPIGKPARSDRGAIILSLPLVTLGGYLSVARLIFLGRPLAMMERFDVHEWAALVKEHRPQIIGAPPPVVKMILDADISPDHFVGVTAYTTGSAPVPVAVKHDFEARYGIPVLVGYGATEFLDAVTGWTPELWAQCGATKAASAGRPRAGVRLRIIDPATVGEDEPREVPIGTEGILEVDPPSRAAHLPSGWLRTNDRARIDGDGFLWILGRADDVIVRGGFKVDLDLVRETLLAHSAIADAAVVALHDDRLGQVPAAAVVVRDGHCAPDEGELTAWVRDRLAPYAVPVVIEAVDEIPLTATQKHRRAEVAEMLSEVRRRRTEQ